MKFFREPLVQFLLLGAALFLVFGAIGNWTSTEQIVVTPTKVEELAKNFRFDNKRPPTQDEVNRLVEDYIREEVLCREAWARGMDRENSVVRRELRQKMEFFNGNAQAALPSDRELQAFLDKHPEMFRKSDGSVPDFASVRDSVQSAWAATSQKEAHDAEYQKLLKKYNVIVQKSAPVTAPSTQLSGAK